jgi:2-oxoglutarate dehydrogenase E2 component (dihydrolipoamide succinyltransferase)
LISDKATLNHSASGTITLKGRGVQQEQVCFTAAAKPEGSVAAPASSQAEAAPAPQQRHQQQLRFRNTVSSSKKILDEKNIAPAAATGTGKDL